jgi:hypothetical protein
MRNTNKIFVGNPERKTPLGRPRRRWEDSIKTDLKIIGCVGVDFLRVGSNDGLFRVS